MNVLLLCAALLFSLNKPLDRALWMWHGTPLLIDAKARSQFFEFLRAPKGDPSHAINVVFLSEVDPANRETSKALGNLISECHNKGIRVDYLCGDASWAEPDQNVKGIALVQSVLNFNASEPKQRQFDGFQFDVEPYSLKDWPSPPLRAGYLHLFDASNAAIKEAGSKLLLGAAIPRWYGAPDLNNLHKDIIDRTDYVAVMDYVSTSKDFVNDPVKIIDYANSAGKKAWLGAECTELPTEPMATFYAKGNAALEDAFEAAYLAYRKSPSFAGVAIEYYETYVALRP